MAREHSQRIDPGHTEVLSIGVEMKSGGDLLLGDAVLFHTIDIDGSCIDSWE
jgi:hypothetical protein